MPNQNKTTQQQFTAMKTAVMNANIELYYRQMEAGETGNLVLFHRLHDARRALDRRTDEIARAQAAFLLSDQNLDALTGKLKGVVNGIANASKSLKDLVTALNGVQQILALLTGLTTLLA